MSTDPVQFRLGDARRFEAAIRRFDEENARDPNLEIADGLGRPRELVYAERLTHWVLKLCPDASEELRLAARCQHILLGHRHRRRFTRNELHSASRATGVASTGMKLVDLRFIF